MSDYLTIGFSKAKGYKPLSKAIMIVERTPFSHAYLKLSNRHFNDFDIYQASKGLVNHVIEETFLQENEVVEEFNIPIVSTEKMAIIGMIRKKLGKPYSVRTLIGIFLLQKFNLKIDFLFDGDHAYICSELVARVLKASGKLPVNLDVDKATPKQLHEICKKYFNEQAAQQPK